MENANQNNARLELIKASEIEPKEIEWLWYPFIPYGKVTLLQGDPGDGKSTFMLTIAALLTRGEPLPFTETGKPPAPISVIYQTTEDDADDTIVPRFIKANGDRERLLFMAMFEQPTRTETMRYIEEVVPFVEDDVEVFSLVASTMKKMRSISDMEFSRLNLKPYLQDVVAK